MLRVRFHGRGGHGIKTASRSLGTAAFLSGRHVQDSPIYGAERRGAAIAAFTRIDREPIRERGVVVDPDLIVVADETLLTDPAAGVLSGVDGASAIFVNTAAEGQALAHQYQIKCPVLTLDLTALTGELLGRASALSAPLGAAACALTGLVSEELMVRAVREELAALHLGPDLLNQNIEVARRIYRAIPAATLRERPVSTVAGELHVPAHVAGPQGVPIIYAPGNSPARHTGSWRIFRPAIDLAACTRCMICLIHCPDGAITLNAQGYPVIDYDNCKGCMICYEDCPVKCIHEQKEVRAW
jgi:pyruvate ferredoxin oxidoreductase gamma subunit